MRRSLLAALLLYACAAGPACDDAVESTTDATARDAAGDDASAPDAEAALDLAPEADGAPDGGDATTDEGLAARDVGPDAADTAPDGTLDAAVPDMASDGALDASPPDMSPDGAVDAALTLDGARPDIGVDAALPPIAACDGDGDCALPAQCIAGGCRAMVEWLADGPGLEDAREVTAGADLDGTLRLMTTVGDTAHFVDGQTDAWQHRGSVAVAISNRHQPLNTARQTTARVHFGVVTAGYRGVVVDGVGAASEDRVIDTHTHAFDADGAVWVVTSPALADRHPVRLWRPGAPARVFDEVTANVPIDAHLHLRFSADGEPEVLRLVGGVGSLVQRFRPEGDGWSVTNVWRRQQAGNGGQGASVTDADGRVYALLASREGDALGLYLVVVGDEGVERAQSVLGLAVGAGAVLAPNTLQLGFDGALYFLLHHPAGANERVTRLYRVDPEGGVSGSRVDAARLVDGRAFESQGLAMAPDGSIYIFTAPIAGPLRVRRWGPAAP